MSVEMELLECPRCRDYNLMVNMVAVRDEGDLIAVCRSTCVRQDEEVVEVPRVVYS